VFAEDIGFGAEEGGEGIEEVCDEGVDSEARLGLLLRERSAYGAFLAEEEAGGSGDEVPFCCSLLCCRWC